jgi:molybdate transport system substrate-binding protein
MRRMLFRIASMLLLLCLAGTGAAENVLRVAVAANFRPAAEAFAAQFERDNDATIRVSSASTGVLAAQLRAGAPFDLLLAADHDRPQRLAQEGFASGPARCYARGSLVLLGADELAPALADPTLSLAIANPETAPYGAAAMAVLERPEFAQARGRRVVRGSNVQQALQYFDSGAADIALVARSLRPASGIPVPENWHPPIDQYAIVSAKSGQKDLAEAFLSYLRSPAVADQFPALGYGPCS